MRHDLIGAALAAAVILGAPVPSGGQEPAESLQEVLRSTLETHEAVQIAGEDLEQASLRRSRYLMSLTPDLSLQAYNQKIGGTGGGEGGAEGEGGGGAGSGPVFFPEGTYYGYSFSLTQPIYTGGRALAAYRGAGDQESALQIQEKIVRRDLLVASAEAYYSVLAAMETVRIGEQAVIRAERNLDLAEKRLELGEGLVTDRLRAEVNLAERQSNLITFRRALADARDGVRRLCGRPLAEKPHMVKPLPDIEGTLDDLVSEALEGRPEREQDLYGIRAAEEDVREKKGRFLPALYAAGSYYGSGEEFDEQETGWQAGVFLQFPIYERASRFYLLKESRSALRQARLRDNGREKDISLEVSRLYNALASSQARLGTLRKQVELAEENSRLAEKRFSVGLADSLETVDAQTALLEAEVGLTAERLRFEVSKLRLARALGRELLPLLAATVAEDAPSGGREAR